MSDLLDQAIVDANALKEAAIKNAETVIIEKYSDDIKSAVEQLLEQEAPPPMMAGLPAAPGPPPAPSLGPPAGPENVAGMPGAYENPPEQVGRYEVDLASLVSEMKLGKLEAKELEKHELVAEELTGAGEELEQDSAKETFVIQETTISNILGENGAVTLGGNEPENMNEYEEEEPMEEDLDQLEEEEYLFEDEDNELEEEEGYEELKEDMFDVYKAAKEKAVKAAANLPKSKKKDVTGKVVGYESPARLQSVKLKAYEPDDPTTFRTTHAGDEPGEGDIYQAGEGESGRPMFPTGMTMAPPVDEPTEPKPARKRRRRVALETDPITVDVGGVNNPRHGLRKDEALRFKQEYLKLYESFNIYKNEYTNLHVAYEQLNEKNNKFVNLLKRTQAKLNEVNLQNAKLHYTNRVLNSVSLNERQKDKIVEAVEKAGTVGEAKIIYETLQSTVGTYANKSKPKSLYEAISRPSSTFLPRKRETSAPETQLVDRMQKLAGIK